MQSNLCFLYSYEDMTGESCNMVEKRAFLMYDEQRYILFLG